MFVSCCPLNVFFSISCRKQPRRCFFSFSPAKNIAHSEARSLLTYPFSTLSFSLNKCLTVGNLTGNKFYGIFQGFIFPTTPALELFWRAIIERISPSAIFPCNFWTGQRLHSQNVMYYINSVFNISVLQLMQLASHLPRTLKTPTNWSWIPIHLFFPCHTWFFLAVNELNLTFLMVLLGSVFLLGWGMEHHTRRWSSIGWIRWLVAAGDLNLRSWINGPRTGGVLLDFWIFFVYNMSYVLCFLLRISTCINYSINACLYMVT